MEGTTPPPVNRSGTEEIKQKSGVKSTPKKASLIGAGAVIVRMPDSNSQRGMRHWVDRREVDEMVLRELEGRRKKHPTVQIVRWEEGSDKVQLKDKMELYFVGHGGIQGFIGHSDWITEYDLREWILLRTDVNLLHLDKIKLVTCNSANPGNDCAFAERLAIILERHVTGKVIGFSQYLLSAPEAKATYAIEPPSARLDAKDTIQRIKAFEDGLRRRLAEKFADLLLTFDGKELSPIGMHWARQVLCRKPVDLNFIEKKFTLTGKFKVAIVKESLVNVLKAQNSGIAWPEGKEEDLETMIEAMQQRNAAAKFSDEIKVLPEAEAKMQLGAEIEWTARKRDARKIFASAQADIRSMAEQEWNERKRRLIIAFAKGETSSEQKAVEAKHMMSAKEFRIKDPPRK